MAADGPLLSPDERLGDAIRTSGIPSAPAEFFADLGNLQVALPVLGAVLAVVTWRTRDWRPATGAAVAMLVTLALVGPLQAVLARPGPPPMAPATGFYPSGHAATAAVAYGICALLLRRRELALGCVVLNVGVGVGLVRQGYHWPVDVIGSWCLSVLLITGLAHLWARYGRQPDGDG
ncbi:phosphatase PAP2 family protein [Streptomyces sp. NPDC046716]|uniref:phosphatase PAP2 family protein n=1 Tax=Streptomyces sp. NPDC046716 TaxID=3157093 RepID=UPI0033E6FEC6